MEREGFVTLWIGYIDSRDSLDEYAELIYTDSGDWLPSKFLADFKIDIDDFDEDFIEKVCHENEVKTLTELIAGSSYEEDVIPYFVNMCGNNLSTGVNSAILLYNFDYDGNIKESMNDGQCFKYIGSVQYWIG